MTIHIERRRMGVLSKLILKMYLKVSIIVGTSTAK